MQRHLKMFDHKNNFLLKDQHYLPARLSQTNGEIWVAFCTSTEEVDTVTAFIFLCFVTEKSHFENSFAGNEGDACLIRKMLDEIKFIEFRV